MLKLHPDYCHNFTSFCDRDMCPLVSVCNEDCVYVWKATYESIKQAEGTEKDVDYLENKVADLENELNSLAEEKDDALSELNVMEEKYNELYDQLQEVLPEVLNEETAEKLYDYYSKSQQGPLMGRVDEWAEEVYTKWSIEHGTNR